VTAPPIESWRPVHQTPPVAAKAPVSHPVAARSDVENNPLRKFAFYSSLGLMLTLLAVLPELLAYLTHTNTYLLYLVGPPAIIGAMFTGAVRRTFRHRSAYYWIAFFVWMVLAAPLSDWKGGSFHRVFDYSRVNILLLFVVGGLAVKWNEIRQIYYTIAAAGLLNLIAARLFMSMVNSDNSRIALTATGTIGNPNDLAAHLLLVLPFLLFIVLDSRRTPLVRMAILGPIGYGVWVILGTGSRGALIALMVMAFFALWRATMQQRIALLVGGAALAALVFAALPQVTLNRLATVFGKEHVEADDSAASRSYLFNQSVKFTLQHPLFGVGPDQFSNHEGHTRLAEGKLGSWHATHCTWTQVSSECGIPALIFYILGLGSALLLVNRTYRTARAEGNIEIANACFCYLLAMVGFLIAMTFLASAYRLYFPIMIGLAIAMSLVAGQQMNSGAATTRQAIAPRA
jgi:O-antigen ligase